MGITGYARVSTSGQELEAQIHALKQAGADVIYSDIGSGAKFDRPEWMACLKSLHRGDILCVVRIDRIGRSLKNLIEIMDELSSREIQLRSLSEPMFDTTTPTGKLAFAMAAAFAEYERALIANRTTEGVAAARANGKRLGRPPALTKEQEDLINKMHASGESISALSRAFNVSRKTIYRVLAQT